MIFAVFFYYQRYRNPKTKGFRPSYSSLGNALQQLQHMVQPRVEYVLEEKMKDEADEDVAGGPKNSGKDAM
jgi:hypothetical protein